MPGERLTWSNAAALVGLAGRKDRVYLERVVGDLFCFCSRKSLKKCF